MGKHRTRPGGPAAAFPRQTCLLLLVEVEVEGGGAVRHYAEPIDVRQRDATPEQFLWRGRLYLVRAVLAHWCEAGEWWRRPEAGLEDGEREFWRVEAAAGRGGAAGVYDLCFDWLRGGWTVARALD